jgi:hypothetical protein
MAMYKSIVAVMAKMSSLATPFNFPGFIISYFVYK